jgi:hypothetical protein
MQVTFNEQDIRSLLEKVRAFDNSIGAYDFFAINSAFDYVVKVTNGTITFHVNELIANESGDLTQPALHDIAGRFVPDGMISTKTAPIASKNGMRSGVVLMVIVLALVFGGIAITVLRNNRNSKRVYIETKGSETTEEMVAQEPPAAEEQSYEVAHIPTEEEVQLDERSKEMRDPFAFLKAETSYKVTLIGNVQIEGTLSNSAAQANYRNITVRMHFYNKNGELLGEEDYRVPEPVEHGGKLSFNFRAVGKYLRTSKAVSELVSATPY